VVVDPPAPVLMLIKAGRMNLYQRNAQPFGGAGGFGLFRNI